MFFIAISKIFSVFESLSARTNVLSHCVLWSCFNLLAFFGVLKSWTDIHVYTEGKRVDFVTLFLCSLENGIQ